ncbi:hypothetical protein PSN45_003617 [Yamadazyma tenuis]|uniref:Gfd2/YDR514C-like C-terminal domain-containing protein n=1 Tax=Candida tenuis (strain ATCC 10573 / BCRC 21748 / CBS 615 / JCM 9827 / NBRC 10315 / NRRL Y-1498 / VKM Y-70) TaxID=590646 RepID=G3AZK4_CANTC|nr:uncharacterized protein CANTEDRAFT_112479 [Yamadazyma tenuis ATCC 10573]EGV65604.1 hypothetical protein CANTEDRAFT_112479 [Yamadazyma tenuis ATCC 10573]WEJ96082.1 hypothetical protein PSN45_003617 [Yamadazyma tenuis]
MGEREDIIKEYVSKSFKRHPKLHNPGAFSMLKHWVEQVYGRKTVLFCVDVEAWERDITKVTEIGVSIFDPRKQEDAIVPTLMNFHIRPKEHNHMKNGRYVPDNSMRFAGDVTHIMTMEDSIRFVQYLIDKYFNDSSISCSLVGHDLHGDIKWLRTLGINFPENAARLDTQVIIGFSSERQMSLVNSLVALGIPYSNLHNAGNDAYYTLLLALKVSDPITRQLFGLDDSVLIQPPKTKRKATCEQKIISDLSEIIDAFESNIYVP